MQDAVMEEVLTDAGKLETSAEGGSAGKETRKPAARAYPNIGNAVAFAKSVTVSNGILWACRFHEAELMYTGQALDMLRKPVVKQTVSGRTARKDAQAQGDDNKNTTLYTGDEATLPEGMDSLEIAFELSVRDALHRPHSISATGFRALTSNGVYAGLEQRLPVFFRLLADNVFSGEWAWRNREEADRFQVVVYDESRIFQSAEELAEHLTSRFFEKTPVHLQVRGVFRLGTGLGNSPVFPSQLMDTSSKGRQFFEVPDRKGNSLLAMRGVKLGNKLKEMDQWYRDYPNYLVTLPVEPLGYSSWLNELLRSRNETLPYYLNALLGTKEEAEAVLADDQAMLFVLGNLMFGGLIVEGKAKADPAEKTTKASKPKGGKKS